MFNKLSDTDKGIALIAGSAISFSSLPILFYSMPFEDTGVAVQVCTRLIVGIVSVLVWQLFHKGYSFSILPPTSSLRSYFAASGFVLLVAFTTYNLSVGLGTSPAKAVLLIYTSPIQTAILSWIFLKEELSLQTILAILGGVVGTLIALGFWRVEDLLQFRFSDSLALINGFFSALVLIFARKSNLIVDTHPFISLKYTLSMAFFWVIIVVFPLSLVIPELMSIWNVSFQARTIPLLLGLGLLGTTCPYFFMYSGSRYLQASIAGFIMLLEPMSVFILQAGILKVPIYWWQIAGGAILLISGYFIRQSRINVKTNRQPARS